MNETLASYVIQRTAALGLSGSALCRTAQISRQTLHTLLNAPDKMPTLPTLLALANALQVHPVLRPPLFRACGRRMSRGLFEPT